MGHDNKNNVRTIWIVFFILLIITTVEVALGLIKPAGMVGVKFLTMHLLNWTFIILTLLKAYYIVAYFMHLRDERKNLQWIITLPSIILIPYLIFIFLVEASYVESML